jgi:hypothetical protein
VRAHRAITALVAVLAVTGALLGGVPGGVAPVRGAEYRLSTDALYVVRPDDRRVDVRIAVEFRNTTPNPPGRFSVFQVIDLAIHSGARDISATDRRGALKVSAKRRDGVTVASVEPRNGVRYRETTHFTLRYSLPDGASRDVRVRQSVVTVPVWSFGTNGKVEVRLPTEYQVLQQGDTIHAQADGDVWSLTSGPISDPAHWLVLLTATLPSTYVTVTRPVPMAAGSLEVQVRSWSDDRAWGRDTLELASAALPRLEKTVGLDLAATSPMVLVESLPAGGGTFSEAAPSGTDMAVGFDEPAFTVLHQLAHAWLTPQLAADRWIREGFASSVAARVAPGLRVDPPFAPAKEAASLDADAFPLVSWGAGQSTARQDRYAYAASWAAIEALRSAVGDDVLRAALRRFAAGLDGYQPLDVEPVPGQRISVPFDSRHLFDQLSALRDADLAPVFRRWIFDDATLAQLPARAQARQDAEALAASAGDWGVPDPVRLALAGWRFDEAEAAIADATAWLKERDALAATAEATGLALPQRLQDAYRAAGGGSAAGAELRSERDVVTAYATARDRLRQPVTPVDRIGLLGGDDPRATLDEAAGAFGDGDLVGASQLTSDALDRLHNAGRNGLVRLISAVIVLAALLVAAVWLIRRRRQRRMPGYTAAP